MHNGTYLNQDGLVEGRVYSFAEDVANAVVQGIGILLSIIGLTVLVAFATLHGDAKAVTASAVFGATLILLYTISTLYHAIPQRIAPRLLGQLDHIAIYLLIAGTYTPFALVALEGPRGWWLFAVVWTLAILGTVIELTPLRRRRWFSIALYLGMGWLVLASFGPLSAALGTAGTTLLIAGGIAYTGGVPFYLWYRLRYHSVLWHLFVLTGSTLHFFAVLLYVLPRS